MIWKLDNPGLLPWLGLVLAPLLLHLLARARPPRYDFSSIAFLRRIARHRLRVRRPQEWLLLLLRTLAVLALVLLFLQPRLFTARKLAGADLRRTAVIVIDATASMTSLDGAQTRFAQAAAEASEVLNGLRSGDTANVVWLRRLPEGVFPEPGANIPALLDEVRRQACSLEAGDIAAAFALARGQLKGLEGAREIYVISDFQSAAWQGAALDAEDDATVLLLRVGSGEGENAAIRDLRAVPAQPLPGETVVFQCEIRNYAPTPQQRSVRFAFGEARQSQEVTLPAWGSATAMFRQKVAAPGTHPVQVSLTPDRFPADDVFYDLVTVREKVTVALVGANDRTASVWARCLDALGWVHVVRLDTWDRPVPPAAQAVFVTGWEGESGRTILELTAAGKAVILEPSRAASFRSDAEFLNGEMAGAWEQADKPWSLRLAQPDHSLFRIFTEGDYGSPAAGAVQARCRVDGPSPWEALIAYADGQPALATLAGNPLCWWWNLPLEPEFGDSAAQPQFVALVGEIVQQARLRAVGEARLAAECGEALLLHTDAPLDAADIRLTGDQGEALPVLAARTAAGAFASEPAPRPGLYTWSSDRHTLSQAVVRFPAVESDLRRLDPARLTPHAVPLSGGAAVRPLRTGHRLWPLFLLLCLGFLLVEGLALRWMERSSTR